jgi:hypothetical protein
LTTAAVHALLVADTSQIGMTHGELVSATGFDTLRVTAALRILRLSGRMFMLGKLHDSRYFATAERQEQCRPAYEAHMAAVGVARLANLRANHAAAARRRAAKLRELRPPKPTKPPKVVKAAKAPKVSKQAAQAKLGKDLVVPAYSPKPAAPKWKDIPAIIPAGVKVQKLPGYQPRTFEPPKWFKGELLREWAELRGQS